MANKVNRLLQDKLNKLNSTELFNLGMSYVGENVIVLYDRRFRVLKVKFYQRNLFKELDQDDADRDRYKGDKTIFFELENGEIYELIDVAKVGDQINVKEQNDNLYLNHTITFLSKKGIIISDGRSFKIPISRTSLITPMLMNIGLFMGGGATSMASQPSSRTLKVGDKFKLKGLGYNEDDTFIVDKIDGKEITLENLSSNYAVPFIWHKDLDQANQMIMDGKIIFQGEVVETQTFDPQIDLEGDFIGKFLNKNATDLLELEKNNRPLFDVVEMTLNMLSKKFGGGENIAEKVDDVIVHSDEIINAVKEKTENIIALTNIGVLSNEGSVKLNNNYPSWTKFNEDLIILVEPNGGYNKVKFKANWEDGSYIIDRVDVGLNDFNPMMQKVGDYIDRPFHFEDELKQDPNDYEWDDEVVVVEDGTNEASYSKEDIENEITSLQILLQFEEDQEKIDEINEKIDSLQITLSLL